LGAGKLAPFTFDKGQIHAVEKRLQPEVHRREYQDGRKIWQAEQAGDRHCLEHGAHGCHEGGQTFEGTERQKEMTTMVYKSPGNMVRKDGTSFGWKIVDDADLDAALGDGWFLTPGAAIAGLIPVSTDDEAKPRRSRPRKTEAV
jgi:hypothetical protein